MISASSFRVFRVLSCFLLLLCGTIPSSPQQPPQPKREKVAVAKQPALTSRAAVISIEGLGGEQLRRLIGELPNLRALVDRGATAAITESVYPSLPASARATILTGLLPVDHGIYGIPSEASTSNRVETIVDLAGRGGLSIWTNPGQSEAERAQKAIDKAAGREANLLLIEFDSYAVAAAKYGLDARETIAALKGIDARIGRIVEAGGNEMTVFVVSDGGRLRVEREFRPNVILERKELLATDKEGRITSWRARAEARGGAAAILVREPADEKLIAEVEKAFKELIEGSDSPIWGVVTRREAARLGSDPRPVLYLDAAPMYVMSDRADGGSTGKAGVRVSAGYLPSRSEARAVFLAAGAGIRKGARIEYARLVDIAPTLARLLGLEMKTARGRVLTELLQQ